MALLMRCPGCHTPLRCGADHVGKKLRCSACNQAFLIRGVAEPRRSARRKPTNVWVLLGVGVLTAAILVVSIFVAVSWYRTPSGPAAPPAESTSTTGTPAGYEQRTGN